MNLKMSFAIVAAKLVSWAIRTFQKRAGSTWPGHIALHMHRHIIREIISKSSVKVILIAGTNGKTTTSSMIRFLLEKKGKNVIQNEEGANLMNGIASTLLKNSNLNGKCKADYAIFEVDENTLPPLLKEITPTVIILLNLFRDQLDRYGEVNTIATKWHGALKDLPKNVSIIVNGDDPQLFAVANGNEHSKILAFGAPQEVLEKKELAHDVDSVYCPVCHEKLQYKGISYSHLGDYVCKNCGFTNEKVTRLKTENLQSSLTGVYNLYNISAVLLAINVLEKFPEEELKEYILEFKPAFGRQEVIEYKGKKIFLMLSKNPTGFNQSIEAIQELSKNKKNPMMILLNDRIPDGRDISWIWDVEFQNVLPLAKILYISGDRTYDMALRFKYCFETEPKITYEKNRYIFENIVVNSSLSAALEEAVDKTEKEETLIILATYSAMLEMRKLLVGQKLL